MEERLQEMVCMTSGDCERQGTGVCMRAYGCMCVISCAEEICEVVFM